MSKYIAKRDLKKLKAILDDMFKINSDLEVIRIYATDLGMKAFTEDVIHLSQYRDILAGKEEYTSYDENNEK